VVLLCSLLVVMKGVLRQDNQTIHEVSYSELLVFRICHLLPYIGILIELLHIKIVLCPIHALYAIGLVALYANGRIDGTFWAWYIVPWYNGMECNHSDSYYRFLNCNRFVFLFRILIYKEAQTWREVRVFERRKYDRLIIINIIYK